APLRRRPVQQRSTQRVERMLNACADLIDELGYDGVTTTLIAERAEVAVGSLYQFFPDKRAVVQALTLRNLELFITAVREGFTSSTPGNWWDAIDMVLEIYIGMHREIPGFARVHFGDVIDMRLMDDARDNNAVIADELTGVLTTTLNLPEEGLRVPMSVAVEAADAILRLAFRKDPMGDTRIVEEGKHMVRQYLASRFSP
ncbi:MAG: TetR family transcriptional regulator, partial [Sciscionella sp.]